MEKAVGFSDRRKNDIHNLSLYHWKCLPNLGYLGSHQACASDAADPHAVTVTHFPCNAEAHKSAKRTRGWMPTSQTFAPGVEPTTFRSRNNNDWYKATMMSSLANSTRLIYPPFHLLRHFTLNASFLRNEFTVRVSWPQSVSKLRPILIYFWEFLFHTEFRGSALTANHLLPTVDIVLW